MAEYIERDAFIADKQKQYCADCDRRKGMKRGKMRFIYDIGEAPCRSCGIDDMLGDIEEYPTADVQPVVHGHWIQNYETDDGRQLRCSECGMVYWVGKGRDGNFCPNCGARMDDEDK